MNAWQIEGAFGLENLKQAQVEEEPLGPGQVRVDIKAASLNYRDTLVVRGLYNPRQPLPLVPCSDGAGEVVEVGGGVKGLAPGDRVAATFSQAWPAGQPTPEAQQATLGSPRPGMLRKSAVFGESGLVKLPAHLSYQEGACLPCAALTAWSSLFELHHLKAGQKVLVLGTGGVSLFGLQFAKLAGAEVCVTSSSDEKLAKAKELGATHGVNYVNEPKWSKAVKRWAPAGVDVVIEVGGAGTFDESTRCLKPGGTMALIGVLSAPGKGVNLTRVLMNQIRVQGVFVGHREGFLAMNQAMEAHRLRPVISHTFGFNDAPAAFEAVLSQKHMGKIVIEMG